MNRTVQSRQQIFIISGPTASGKTALGHMLEKKYGEQIGVLDEDQLREFDDDISRRHADVKEEIVRFVSFNTHKRALFLIGFFDNADFSDTDYVEFVSSFSTERYYLTKPLPELLKSFFGRLESLKQEIKDNALQTSTEQDYVLYEAEMAGKHAAYGFLKTSESFILERIDELVYKFDPQKKIVYTQKEKRKNNIIKATLTYDGNDDVQVDVETTKGTRAAYIPPVHARRIWALAYRLHSDGRFGKKHQPRYADSIYYDGYYGSGREILELVRLITIFIK